MNGKSSSRHPDPIEDEVFLTFDPKQFSRRNSSWNWLVDKQESFTSHPKQCQRCQRCQRCQSRCQFSEIERRSFLEKQWCVGKRRNGRHETSERSSLRWQDHLRSRGEISSWKFVNFRQFIILSTHHFFLRFHTIFISIRSIESSSSSFSTCIQLEKVVPAQCRTKEAQYVVSTALRILFKMLSLGKPPTDHVHVKQDILALVELPDMLLNLVTGFLHVISTSTSFILNDTLAIFGILAGNNFDACKSAYIKLLFPIFHELMNYPHGNKYDVQIQAVQVRSFKLKVQVE